MANILAKIFGTQSERDIKKMSPTIAAINALEPAMKAMTDEQLAAQAEVFREKLKRGATLDDILVPAFATVREAGRRVLNMRHFDVQLMGGIALHQGKIAEMKTGEGKTLVAPLAVYLNALEGKGVHVVTVNDYLAKRDSEWMGKLYKALGMSVGAIIHDLDDSQRKQAYAADITYGTNNEFGFDYLRDNMKFRAEDRVQRGHSFAIVDEVDSILIDEARTPLIISGPSNEPTDIYYKINRIVPFLKLGIKTETGEPGEYTTTGDYTVDEKAKTAELTDEGIVKVQQFLGVENMYDNTEASNDIVSCVQMAIRAQSLYQRDVDYVVKNGEAIIVDEFTGRLMPGRRWNDGLHQSVEAKEGLVVQPENQTLAAITFQNYFRMYDKLAGMTGTAQTEAAEFGKIYKLDVVQIPTNKPMLRKDFNDLIYRGEKGKFHAAAEEIKGLQEKGQPVLIGTVSIEKSEELSAILNEMGVKHEVLNAKNNEREAEIIAQAGRKGAVTVSTNMAGRGTDILLGGNPDFMAKRELVNNEIARKIDPQTPAPEGIQADGKTLVFYFDGAQYSVPNDQLKETVAHYKVQTDKEHDEVAALGGLFILGTERHESRRIDNQLRGRAGRQGDPGSSRFYISLEDKLSRVFGGEKLKAFMTRLGMQEDEALESKLISKLVEAAQKGVEQQNFSARDNVIKYDDVMNKQREVIYGMRNELMDNRNEKGQVSEMIAGCLGAIIDKRYPEGAHPEQCDWANLAADIDKEFDLAIPVEQLRNLDRKKLEETISEQLFRIYREKEEMAGADNMRSIEQAIMLQVIDSNWKDFLPAMDSLKMAVGWRTYAQLDPLVEFKKEGYYMFKSMMESIEDETVQAVFRVRPVQFVADPSQEPAAQAPLAKQFSEVAVPLPDKAPEVPAPAALPGLPGKPGPQAPGPSLP